METPAIWFYNICRKNGLVPTDSQIQLLDQYVGYLLEWNHKINLVSRKDEEQVWQNHILHSVSPLFKLKLDVKPHIMDLGTGGGLPGIPLKILLPESEFIVVDSTRKKVLAVQDMIDRLGLKGVTAIWGRAEELVSQKNLISHFDYIVARAVAPLKDLIKWSVPFVRSNRSNETTQSTPLPKVPAPALIALKGGDLEDELAKAKRGDVIRSVDVIDLVFPGSEEISSGDKKIVVVRF